MSLPKVYLALGGNLGSRRLALAQARKALQKVAHGPLSASSLYETEPMGPGPQRRYLNQCISINCSLSPRDLLRYCKDTEKELGRRHREKWGPREIDIDILWMEGETCDSDDLKIPHPGIPHRPFVLIPLAELSPHLILPGFEASVAELAARWPAESNGVSLYRPAGAAYAAP